jgi:hypothetical protein
MSNAQWIKVKDRLPQDETPVLVLIGGSSFGASYNSILIIKEQQ